jgi:hypothetical protein
MEYASLQGVDEKKAHVLVPIDVIKPCELLVILLLIKVVSDDLVSKRVVDVLVIVEAGYVPSVPVQSAGLFVGVARGLLENANDVVGTEFESEIKIRLDVEIIAE